MQPEGPTPHIPNPSERGQLARGKRFLAVTAICNFNFQLNYAPDITIFLRCVVKHAGSCSSAGSRSVVAAGVSPASPPGWDLGRETRQAVSDGVSQLLADSAFGLAQEAAEAPLPRRTGSAGHRYRACRRGDARSPCGQPGSARGTHRSHVRTSADRRSPTAFTLSALHRNVAV